MARNERSGNWSQPRRSTPAKSQPSGSRGLGTADFDDLGDIMNVLTGGEKSRNKRDTWRISQSVPKNGNYTSSDCCLKNGRVQCSCMWPKNNYLDCQKQSSYNLPPKPPPASCGTVHYDNKSWSNSSNTNSGYFGTDKMPEEFILDDNELCLLNYYDIPINVPKRPHNVRNVGKVKTVSIIDTLSELASGATDREDEGGFSSAVSESAILNSDLYRNKARHARQTANRRGRGFRSNYVSSPPFSGKYAPEVLSNAVSKSAFNPPVKAAHSGLSSSLYSENLDDGNFSCSSLKRTLKYLRKAVSTNVVEEEARVRRQVRASHHEKQDASRLCFSDSEVWDAPEHFPVLRKDKPEAPNSRTKSRSLLAVAVPPVLDQSLRNVPLFRGRIKSAVPDWIQDVFNAAKKGDVEKMKQSLKDIDSSLIRNLSDDHGNNLWHICAVHNNFECLNWLCSHNLYQGEALKDENKNGFTPVALAVKHGSLLSVQWLIHNTDSKSQLLSKSGSRSLLHVAARYGQDSVVEWLIGYMISQDLEIGISDSEGNTPLHLAAKYGHIASVKALVFHSGSLKSRNEHGLKPLDLAAKHSKTVCADYLVAIESCYNLASYNLRHSWNIQQLQKENAEIKCHFKELLTLTKRLQHRQRELVQSLTRMNFSEKHTSGTNERSSEKSGKYLDDYSQLLSTIMTDEEHRLLMVEDKWKKSRRQLKFTDSKKSPLDILRSQFNHILEKIVSQTPPIPTPETSEDSWQSGDEDIFQAECEHASFSPPDVVNSLSPQTSVPYLDTGRNIQNIKGSSPKVPKTSDRNIGYKPGVPTASLKGENRSAAPVSKSTPGSARDVNLQTFFKQNPNLRQSSETCAVLEVLEPSSSDSEECIKKKKRLAKSMNTDKEVEQSSSSSVVETLSPYSCRISSSESKASGSRSSSNGSRQNTFPKAPRTSNHEDSNNNSTSADKSKTSAGKDNGSSEGVRDKGSVDSLCTSGSTPEVVFSVEPDLIRGTQKKKMPSPSLILDKDRRLAKELADGILTDNISTEDSESLEADRSFCSAVDVPDAVLSASQAISETPPGIPVKKKSFLLKFALRGRWPSSKASVPRSPKNEISAEEFRETYSRSAAVDSPPSTSQAPEILANKRNSISSKPETESIRGSSPSKDLTSSSEQLDDCSIFSPPPSISDSTTLNSVAKRFLPPRRDPPPAPPLDVKDDDQEDDNSDDDVSLGAQKSTFSLSSCIGDCVTPPSSLHNSYITTRSSDLWHSPDSKSLFRPASSASRFDSPSRAEGSFTLNKSSSASTEILSVLDSSTAGRQSPAPSEVSKTESALSPPSDVSKTESTRHLSQLGRIEESAHLKATSMHQKEEIMKEIALVQEIKPESKKKKKSKKMDSDKPWYEFSDEEDIIVPQKYQAVSVSLRSSSEDEEVVTS